MMKSGIANIMKQAQQMQASMQKLQQNLAVIEVVGEAGANMVRVTMNGLHDVKRIELSDEIMNEDKEVIEDLLAAAMNDANRRVKKLSEEKMSSLSSSMGLPAGLNLPF